MSLLSGMYTPTVRYTPKHAAASAARPMSSFWRRTLTVLVTLAIAGAGAAYAAHRVSASASRCVTVGSCGSHSTSHGTQARVQPQRVTLDSASVPSAIAGYARNSPVSAIAVPAIVPAA